MKRFLLAAFFYLSFSSMAQAQEKPIPAIQKMTEEQMISTAQSAAPPDISKEATIMVPGPDGQMRVAKQGTNNFTCIPDISGQEAPDPFCGDEAATQWIMDAMNKEERPTNSRPGIAYMAQGGWHWEKDGKIVMDPAEPGAKRVKEPPHWMIMWPFAPEEAELPVKPSRFGAYIMYEGTPYAHLMIHQDPKNLAR